MASEIPAPRSSSKRHEDDSKAKKKQEITQPPKAPIRQPVRAVAVEDVNTMKSLDDPGN
jgi:hypothetical protein